MGIIMELKSIKNKTELPGNFILAKPYPAREEKTMVPMVTRIAIYTLLKICLAKG
jgi:hypothetical protein